ncbi:hypothetical protein GGX14DRAFT_638099 [Mycena pura]|uniref:DUF6589 domain-containing protein n=1 Tax=Mycena pura TaxID=153505 RepID=A0AAD6YNX4_9AGAR|nr:hypothetical protein GGX14DRAFT_638099 [Mycena pura]
MDPPSFSQRRRGVQDPEPVQLAYNEAFWDQKLSPDLQKVTIWRKCHLIFSLILFVNIPLVDVFLWLFSSRITRVRQRTGKFLQAPGVGQSPDDFGPARVYAVWHTEWPQLRPWLHYMVEQCANEIAEQESDRIIEDKSLSVRIKDLTATTIPSLLKPGVIMDKYRQHAPFTWGVLKAFSTKPNRYRREKAAKQQKVTAMLDGEDDDEPEESEEPELLKRAELTICAAFGMLAFIRNRSTNLLPLLLGLFFMINGSSTRTMNLLNNIGLSVSVRTVERLKLQISQTAVDLAIELLTSGRLYLIIYDNINIYLRKWEQRLTNRNQMLNITNSAVIAIDEEGLDAEQTVNLDAWRALRGARKDASFASDIRPSKDDQAFVRRAFRWQIADIIVSHTPGHLKWKDRPAILEAVADSMPEDRPLQAKKTDARPFGVFDVNEGTKKGQAELDEQMRLRARHVDRMDFLKEQSALWHFALQATHMIMKAHYGEEGEMDPTSLARHKSQLHRIWDPSKPNYAAAKSLIRHSLVARLLHIVMVLKGWTWTQLETWEPDLDQINALVDDIVRNFATSDAARRAKGVKDDWMAHTIYFIRDALLFLEFEAGVRYADPGRVLRIMKYWVLMFRGAGQHNYARECVEFLIFFKYETPPMVQKAMERAWFYNRWGVRGRSIPADLYLEQLNYWVKVVNKPQGSGVTVEYIIKKGSACIEAFRDISHEIATLFGDPDRRRRHKEVKFETDLRTLIDDLELNKIHHPSTVEHFVPAKGRKRSIKTPVSQIVDIQVRGTEIWADGNFSHYIQASTWDPALNRYPLGSTSRKPADKSKEDADESVDDGIDANGDDGLLTSGTVFDNADIPFEYSNYVDLHGESGLGGGDVYGTGEVIVE